MIKRLLRPVRDRVDGAQRGVKRALDPGRFYAGQIWAQTCAEEDFSVRPKPNIVVEINNTCNLSCLMCDTKDARRQKGQMSVEEFARILDEVIVPKSQHTLVVHTVGEPLVHAHFEELAGEAHRRGIRLLMTTNGLFIKKRRAAFEKYRGLFAGINISVDGANKETYDKIRVGGEYEEFVDNLEWLVATNRRLRLNIPIRIQSVLSADNINDVPDFFKVYTKYVGAENISFNLISNLSADAEETDYYASQNLIDKESVLKAPCLLPFCQMHILYDGTFSACCRDYHGELILGDLKNESWPQVWNGPKYDHFRRLHLEKKTETLPLCRSCYGAPSAFTFAVNNFIHYLHYTNRLGDGDLRDKLGRFVEAFSRLYHAKDYDTDRLAKILATT